MKVKSESEVAQPCPTLSDPTGLHASNQAPPSMGFSRQEYWSGVPLPSPSLGYIPINKSGIAGSYGMSVFKLPVHACKVTSVVSDSL